MLNEENQYYDSVWTPKGIDLEKRELSQKAVDKVHAFFDRFPGINCELSQEDIDNVYYLFK